MPVGRLTIPALCGALLLPLLVPSLQSSARADVYHAVANGETLSIVAAKYHVSVEQLRAANSLQEGDSTPLGAMLLRVPGIDDKNSIPVYAKSVPNNMSASFGDNSLSPAQSSMGLGSGTIGKSVVETVRVGDTWDSIATRYRNAGNDVSTEALERRNNWIDLPAPGNPVIVPLSQVAYSAPVRNYAPRVATNASFARPSAQTVSVSRDTTANAFAAPRTLDGGVVASGEIDLPFGKATIANARPIVRTGTPARRGTLPSRGGYGEMTRQAMGGVRVLSPTEDATAPPASQGRFTSRATSAPTATTSIAKVARVSGNGARIRRLPQADAVTLYNCNVGTQLAVLRQSGAWSAVLMSDRSTGWLPSKYLSVTAQTVDVSAQIVSSDPGGQVNGFASNYAGENPMVAQALRWLGTPYRYGGTGRSGIDCSSLVQHAFAACGYSLPRTAATQAKIGVAVLPAQLRAGDRLYFSASGTRIDHTGLYMGDGLFVHASGSGRHVMVSNLFTPRNWNIFVGARR